MGKFFINAALYLLCTFTVYFIAVYFFFNECKPYFLGIKPVEYYYANFQFSKIKTRTPYRNIIVGDSHASTGLDPKTMGAGWINLSVAGEGIFDGFLTLKYYLRQNKVDTLLLQYSTSHLEYEADWTNLQTIPLKFPEEEDLRNLEAIEYKAGELITDTSASASPLAARQRQVLHEQHNRRLRYSNYPLAYRETFLDGLFELLKFRIYQKQKGDIIQRLTDNLGQFTMTDGDSSNAVIYTNLSHRFKPNVFCASYLDSIVALAKTHNIVAYLVVVPVNKSTYDASKGSIYQSSLDAFFKEIAKKYPSLKIIERPVFLPCTWFGDSLLHINSRGVGPYTTMVKNEIQER